MKTETAIIQINPQGDTAVLALHNQVVKVAQHAAALTITNDRDVKDATADLSIISGLKKAIEKKRTDYTRPINSHLKDVNEAFGTLTEPLTEADKTYRQKILAYRAEVDRKRREAEEINLLRMEAAKKEMKLKGELTEPVSPVEVTPPSPDHYRSDIGTLGKTMIPKWEVEDFAKVPNEYKEIDATKVGKLVRAGLRIIPGIRIWEEESLRVTARKNN